MTERPEESFHSVFWDDLSKSLENPAFRAAFLRELRRLNEVNEELEKMSPEMRFYMAVDRADVEASRRSGTRNRFEVREAELLNGKPGYTPQKHIKAKGFLYQLWHDLTCFECWKRRCSL